MCGGKSNARIYKREFWRDKRFYDGTTLTIDLARHLNIISADIQTVFPWRQFQSCPLCVLQRSGKRGERLKKRLEKRLSDKRLSDSNAVRRRRGYSKKINQGHEGSGKSNTAAKTRQTLKRGGPKMVMTAHCVTTKHAGETNHKEGNNHKYCPLRVITKQYRTRYDM